MGVLAEIRHLATITTHFPAQAVAAGQLRGTAAVAVAVASPRRVSLVLGQPLGAATQLMEKLPAGLAALVRFRRKGLKILVAPARLFRWAFLVPQHLASVEALREGRF
jgi:hypothetical protein